MGELGAMETLRLAERDGALLVGASVKIAALRASSFRPCPLPDALSSKLKPLLENP